MKTTYLQFLILFLIISLVSWKTIDNTWIIEKHKGYNLLYTSTDTREVTEYNKIVQNGITSVTAFFSSPYKEEFTIFIHPNRHSFDSALQKDWNMPDFKSECWMVASGIASKLDMISPVMWSNEACEHIYTDSQKTLRLIAHELVHVYHGQKNASPDFSNVEGIDWFVEGLATYASGQCDSMRIVEVKKAISGNNVPKSLDSLWTGKLKYGLCGSVVMYIDNQYGRNKLKELLPFNRKTDLLSKLNITEPELLDGWKKFMLKW